MDARDGAGTTTFEWEVKVIWRHMARLWFAAAHIFEHVHEAYYFTEERVTKNCGRNRESRALPEERHSREMPPGGSLAICGKREYESAKLKQSNHMAKLGCCRRDFRTRASSQDDLPDGSSPSAKCGHSRPGQRQEGKRYTILAMARATSTRDHQLPVAVAQALMKQDRRRRRSKLPRSSKYEILISLLRGGMKRPILRRGLDANLAPVARPPHHSVRATADLAILIVACTRCRKLPKE